MLSCGCWGRAPQFIHMPEITRILQNVKFYARSAARLVSYQIVLHQSVFLCLLFYIRYGPVWPSRRYTRRISERITTQSCPNRAYCTHTYVKHCLLWVTERWAVVCVADVTSVLRNWVDSLYVWEQRLKFHCLMWLGLINGPLRLFYCLKSSCSLFPCSRDYCWKLAQSTCGCSWIKWKALQIKGTGALPVLNMSGWNGLCAWSVVMLVAAFLSETVKVSFRNWAAASKDLVLDTVHRTLRLPLLFICLFKVQWSSTQDPEPRTGKSVVIPVIINHCHCTKSHTAHPVAFNNTWAKFETDGMNGSRAIQATNRQIFLELLDWFWFLFQQSRDWCWICFHPCVTQMGWRRTRLQWVTSCTSLACPSTWTTPPTTAAPSRGKMSGRSRLLHRGFSISFPQMPINCSLGFYFHGNVQTLKSWL